MEKIIIVDDTPDIRAKWKKLLNKERFQVIEAINSHQLFATLVNEDIDLIIIELFLGAEHGYYIIKRLKEDPNYAKIPIMVASGERRRASILEVINTGVDDYLIKPVDTELFLKRVKRLIKLKRALLKVQQSKMLLMK